MFIVHLIFSLVASCQAHHEVGKELRVVGECQVQFLWHLQLSTQPVAVLKHLVDSGSWYEVRFPGFG